MDKRLEIEVKLACDSLDCLAQAGFELSIIKPRHFEDNWLLDFDDQRLFKQGAALRVRAVEGKGLITYKGVVREGGNSLLKVREEVEADTSDPEQAIELFERLGFQRAFRYQKYRTVYNLALDGRTLEIVFDETPLGNFVEIEGSEEGVLKVLRAAGFSADEIIRDSYPELQASRCKAMGIPLEDLVFQ